MVKKLPLNAEDTASIPGQGMKSHRAIKLMFCNYRSLHAATKIQYSQKKINIYIYIKKENSNLQKTVNTHICTASAQYCGKFPVLVHHGGTSLL